MEVLCSGKLCMKEPGAWNPVGVGEVKEDFLLQMLSRVKWDRPWMGGGGGIQVSK